LLQRLRRIIEVYFRLTLYEDAVYGLITVFCFGGAEISYSQTTGTLFRFIQTMPRQTKIIFSKMLLDVRVHLFPKYVMETFNFGHNLTEWMYAVA
jgi:hypothetical protein